MSNLNLFNQTTAQWEEVKVETKLNVLKNTVTLSADVNWIFIGITNYNPADDALFVVKKDTTKGNHQLIEGEDYTFNTSSLKIFSKDGSNWKQGDVFQFTVWKNVDRPLPSADGSLLQDYSVPDVKLAMPITPALTDIYGNTSSSLANRLLGIDNKIKDIEKETPFIFVANYEDLVTNMGTSTEDWTNAIQTALNAEPTYKQVVLPMQSCRITKMLEIPVGTSIIGFGNASQIIADFGYWQTADYRAIHIAGIEGINYGENSYNQYFENFSVIGKNNASLETTGIDIGTSATITIAEGVNYAILFANFRNILVTKFDTAWNLEECWSSNFTSLSVLDCRVGLKITGKSVNLTFSKMMMTNFSSDYTSNAGKRYGVLIDNKTYSDGSGRPEGLVFSNSLIFGADTNLNIKNVLYSRFTEMVLDGAFEDAVIIETPDNVSIKGCYIYTSGAGKSCINLTSSSNQDTVINIYDNCFTGTTGTQYGVYCFGNTVYRYGVTVQNNTFIALSNPIYFNYVGRSKILNNYGRSNRGDFIYLQSECGDTKVDGNNSIDSYPILRLHPTTAETVQIGDNTSANTRTSYQGVATIAAGSNVGSCGNAFYFGATDLYYRAVTLVQPLGNIGNFWVRAETSGTEATITCSTPPSVDTKVYYKTIAVPYTATV